MSQMCLEVNRHCGAIVGDQHTAVCLDPAKNVRVGCAFGRRRAFTDGVDTYLRFSLLQLRLDDERNVLVEQKANRTHTGKAI